MSNNDLIMHTCILDEKACAFDVQYYNYKYYISSLGSNVITELLLK